MVYIPSDLLRFSACKANRDLQGQHHVVPRKVGLQRHEVGANDSSTSHMAREQSLAGHYPGCRLFWTAASHRNLNHAGCQSLGGSPERC